MSNVKVKQGKIEELSLICRLDDNDSMIVTKDNDGDIIFDCRRHRVYASKKDAIEFAEAIIKLANQ